MLTFIHARILTEDGVIPQGWLTVRDGYIDSFGEGNPPTLEGEVINASGKTLSPGFLDIHVHGGGGHEAMDATGETLEALSRFYAQHGVTGFLPTTWTAPNEAVTAALNAIAEHQDRVTGAKILGAHVEGPYINPLKPGAQSSDFIRPADVDEFKAWEQSGVIKLVTVAPEYRRHPRPDENGG
jgi:N-acetylglucosamine-6-phosphate deacetylase